MATAPGDDGDGQLPLWTPDVTDEQLVTALEHGTAWPGGTDGVEDRTWVVAAAGVWDDLGCVVVLFRGEDGLDHDVHVVPRDSTGRWRPTGVSCGTTLPEWVLERPDAGPERWCGAQTQVVADQVTGCGTQQDDDGQEQPRWGAGVAVLCSRQVDLLHLVHRSPSRDLVRELTLAVPPSGLVAFACPVVHHTDSVLLRALGADGAQLSEDTYWPLLDADRHWPDEALWAGSDGW